MLRSRSKWQSKVIDETLDKTIVNDLLIPIPVARMLLNRGYKTKEQIDRFLNPSLEELYDPYLLDGMTKAIERINLAIELDEKICIYGDYDVDGISSTSLLLKVFHQLEAKVDYYIPNRFTEGYGLNKNALEYIKEQGFQLVITVDTGISAIEESVFAKELGLDLIITDHHEPPSKLPEAIAVINPKKETCTYPCKMLAGVGVAFKLATALLNHVPEEFLDIVALGTIADLVPLVDENRIFAYYGLRTANLRKNMGLDALLKVAGVSEEITESHIGFAVGPRLNASGRLDSARQAVELLITKDLLLAKEIAENLDQLNRQRQQLVEEITEEAIEQVEANPDIHQHFILVYKKDWHLGVVGIVASRLVEKYYRPVIVLSLDEKSGLAKGSARGIQSFDLYVALTQCKEWLLHYGGHTMAAGMTLHTDNLILFHQELSQIARATLSTEDYIPVTLLEDELNLEQVNESLIEEVKRLAPFGSGNPVPYFVLRGLNIQRMQMLGEQQNHLKLLVKKQQSTLDAIGFRFGDVAKHIAKEVQVDLVGELHINEWNGRRSPQLFIRDLAIPHLQIFDWRSNRDPMPRLQGIDVSQCIYLCSRDSSYVKERMGVKAIYDWERLETDDGSDFLNPYIIFIDPPPNMDVFHKVLAQCKEAERLYFTFGDKVFDDVLVKMPSREDFKLVYVAIVQRKKINKTSDLIKLTGLGKKTILFILRVLEELQLVELTHEYITYHSPSSKKELENSIIYQEQLAKEKVLELLIHSNYEQLCQYVYGQTTFELSLGGKQFDYELQR